jgi:hypothetical protein
MPDEKVLRAKAREAVRSGKLPSRRPDRTGGGPEVGATCTVCGEAITKDQLEFKVQFADDGSNPGLDKFHIHVRCFAAWVLERPHHRSPFRLSRARATKRSSSARSIGLGRKANAPLARASSLASTSRLPEMRVTGGGL